MKSVGLIYPFFKSLTFACFIFITSKSFLQGSNETNDYDTSFSGREMKVSNFQLFYLVVSVPLLFDYR